MWWAGLLSPMADYDCGLESRSHRRGQRRRRWWSAGARASTDGRRIRERPLAGERLAREVTERPAGRTTGRAPPSAGRGRGRDGERGRGPRGCGLAEYGPTYCCRRPRSLRRRGGSGCAWTRRRGRPGTLGTHVICRRGLDRRGPVSKLCAVECLCPAFLSLPSIDVHSKQNVVPPLVQQPMADRAPG